MSTHGYLQLSFTLLHSIFHHEYRRYYKNYMGEYLRTLPDFKARDYKSRPKFLFYKIKEGESFVDVVMQKDKEDEEDLSSNRNEKEVKEKMK